MGGDRTRSTGRVADRRAAAAVALFSLSAVVCAAPPATVADVLVVLERYPVDRVRISEALRKADLAPPDGASGGQLAQFYLDRGRIREEVGRNREAIADFRAALAAARGRIGEGQGAYSTAGIGNESRIREELAAAEARAGNFVAAWALREESFKLYQSARRFGYAHGAATAFAAAAAESGDLRTARRYLEVSASLLTRLAFGRDWPILGESWQMARARAEIALAAAEGRHAHAEKLARSLLLQWERVLPRWRRYHAEGYDFSPPERWEFIRARDELALAHALLMQRQAADAELHARNALGRVLRHAGASAVEIGHALVVLSRIVLEQGRPMDAARLAAEAVRRYELAQTAPESHALAAARRALGTALVGARQWAQALAVFRAMHQGLSRDPQMLERFGPGTLDWAHSLIRSGDPESASRMLHDLVADARARWGEDSYAAAEATGMLGMAYATHSPGDGALALLRESARRLLAFGQREPAGEFGNYMRSERYGAILAAYVDLLFRLQATGAAPADLDIAGESFRVAEAARSSGVERALVAASSRLAVGDSRVAVEVRRDQDLQHRIAALSESLVRLLAVPPQEQLKEAIAAARDELKSARAEREVLRERIAASLPDYPGLASAQATSIARLKAALKPHETLLAYFSGDERVYYWSVNSESAVFGAAEIGAKEVADLVRRVRAAVDVEAGSFAEFPPFDLESAFRLYSGLLAPSSRSWQRARTLIVVPHGILGSLPFSALPAEAASPAAPEAALFSEYRKVAWLVRSIAVAQVPSATSLVSLRERRVSPQARRPFVGFGDPAFQATREAPAASARRNLKIERVAPGASVDGAGPVSVPNSASLAQLAPLPDTADELRDIARVLQASDADVHLQLDATETRVRTMPLADRRIVAFATHGLVAGDLDGLHQPALALSAPALTGEKDADGLLTLDEILALRLDADWVVLSACNTASGDRPGAEALSGLGRAFFYAGARALLASGWPVETVSARLLTTELFRRQTTAAVGRAEALRQTMLWLIDEAVRKGADGEAVLSYGHPLFWAAFAVVGDPD
jgi:CHAT domain-containing protein